jgi:GDP-4-dehydro-6-deoxy-D-mannose reductase
VPDSGPDDRAPPGPLLVTGAEGFVGRHLTASMRARWPGVSIATPAFDVRDKAATARIVADIAPSTCVHLAAISSVMQAAQDPALAWQVNLHGALNVAQAILAHAPDCQMLFVSSADAYGASFRAGTPLDETAALAPMTLYGATKAAADLALGVLAGQGLRVVRLRAFNHIGAGQSPDFAVASFARQLARIGAGLQPPVMQVGRLDTHRDFLDVRDVCAAYIACIARRDSIAPGTIINIASGQARRIGDVLQDLIGLAGVEPEIQAAAPQLRATDILCASGDARLAATLLGWSPHVPWRETLRTILQDAVMTASSHTP